ncbi:MAG: hypothetical protein NVSMB2_24260 [Chloroflexota bacterium]
MPALDNYPALSPLQIAIYETDLLNLSLREAMRLVTARMGFFVGQHRYMQERVKIARFIDQYGPPTVSARWDLDRNPQATAPQVGSP